MASRRRPPATLSPAPDDASLLLIPEQPVRLRRQRTERAISILADPTNFDDLCSEVADGGTLYEWCKSKDIRSSDVRIWIATDADRAKKFAAAEEARKSALKDRAIGVIRDVVDADLREAFDENGDPLPANQLPDSLAASLIGSETTVDTKTGTMRTKYKFTPRMAGAEQLGRASALFKDQLDITGPISVTVQRGLGD